MVPCFITILNMVNGDMRFLTYKIFFINNDIGEKI